MPARGTETRIYSGRSGDRGWQRLLGTGAFSPDRRATLVIVRLVAYVLAAAAAVLAVGSISEQRLAAYDDRAAVFTFALVLGLINATIRPILRILTLPLTCLTFGLFALALNAGLFGLAAWLTPGITVTFWGAVLGAIVASIAGGIIFSVLDER